MFSSQNLLDEINVTLEEIYENISDNINVIDKNGVFVLVGRRMLDDCGLQLSDILGKHVDELVSKGYWSRSTTKEALDQNKDINGVIRAKSGQYLLSTSKIVRDTEGNVKYVITTSRPDYIIEELGNELEKERLARKQYEGITGYLQDRMQEDNTVIATSSKMESVLAFCRGIAKGDGTVLITGESGTGKEVCAQYIHRNSLRNKKPFITVDCSAIPENLVESELFGYKRGAFTGADPKGRIGLLEMANEGTIFLDEIGELPVQIQPKLLRFLENGEVRAVGSSRSVKVDVRVIAATNRDLKDMMLKRQFREDLFYRLNVLPVSLPPLRERRQDIIPLAEHFLRQLNKKYDYNLQLSKESRERLYNRDWSGNIRELRNVVEQLFFTSGNRKIESTPVEKTDVTGASVPDTAQVLPLKEATRNFERQYIESVIDQCGGNATAAAQLLGVHRTTLYKIKRGQTKPWG